ncbi:MAG: hypothetical protein HY812_09435 [Planctomycetes bacterium]|nr:hypothetical protein [Planctomycetota bacterium]
MKLRDVLFLASLLLLCPRPAGAQEEVRAPAASWIPEDAVFALEILRPAPLLEMLCGEKATALVTSLPAYRRNEETKEFQDFLGLVKLLEADLETDWRSALARLTSGGFSFALCPGGAALLIVDGSDADMLQSLHGVLLGIARAEAEKQGKAERVSSSEHAGVTCWTFDDKGAHALIGTRLVLASSQEALRAALELQAGDAGASLATVPAFQAARLAALQDAAACLYLDLARLGRAPRVQRALEENRRNPLAALLLSGMAEALRQSSWLAGALRIEQDALVLEATLNEIERDPQGPAAFALPAAPGDGALPHLALPRRVAAISLYRDLARFYAAKDDLFPERTSELIFFENMMGIFFTGRELTGEVLAQARPAMRLVVAEQEYDLAIGTPLVQLPAFAAVLELDEPEEFAEVIEEAWQKALGLINFTRGQQALPGLIIDRVTHGDTRMTVAYFSSAGAEDRARLHQRFNFRPALALRGDHLILSSSEGLARDILDALDQDARQAPLAGADTLIELDGGQLASLLEANHATLVRQNMIEKGHTMEEAEAEVSTFIALARLVDRLELCAGSLQGATRFRAAARLNVEAPAR